MASLSEHLVHLYLMDPYIIPQATPQHDKVLIFGQYTNEPLICANTHTTTTKLVNGFLQLYLIKHCKILQAIPLPDKLYIYRHCIAMHIASLPWTETKKS